MTAPLAVNRRCVALVKVLLSSPQAGRLFPDRHAPWFAV